MTDGLRLQDEAPFLQHFGGGQFLLALCDKVQVLGLTSGRENHTAQDRVDWGVWGFRAGFAEGIVGQVR